jgi:hypothetical protein
MPSNRPRITAARRPSDSGVALRLGINALPSREGIDRSAGERGGSGYRTTADELDSYRQQFQQAAEIAESEIQAARETGDRARALGAVQSLLDLYEELRRSTQEGLSFGGRILFRVLSEEIERPSTWTKQLGEIEKGRLVNPSVSEFDVYGAIARSVGRSNPAMGLDRLIGKAASTIALGISAVITLRNVRSAPDGQKLKTLYHEALSFLWGFIGSYFGANISTALIVIDCGVRSHWVAVCLLLIMGLITGWYVYRQYRLRGKGLGRAPFAFLLGSLVGWSLGSAYGLILASDWVAYPYPTRYRHPF